MLKHLSINEIYGWGAGGQITSGATMHYAYIFSLDPDATATPTHNIVLQTIFDPGVLGLAVFVAATARTISVLRHAVAAREPGAAALVAMLVVILLAGATEVSPTYYSDEALLMVMLIIGAAAGLEAVRRHEVSGHRATALVQG